MAVALDRQRQVVAAGEADPAHDVGRVVTTQDRQRPCPVPDLAAYTARGTRCASPPLSCSFSAGCSAAADAVDGAFAGQGEQGGVGADTDEAQALVGVAAGGFGIGSEDAGGEAGRLGHG